MDKVARYTLLYTYITNALHCSSKLDDISQEYGDLFGFTLKETHIHSLFSSSTMYIYICASAVGTCKYIVKLL